MKNSDAFKILSFCAVLAAFNGCGDNQNNQSVVVPVVTGVTPSNLASSSLPRTITVTGTNFQAGLIVELSTSSGSSQPAASQVTSTSFQIAAVFPSGNCAITVTNPGGQPSVPFSFGAKTATGINFAPPVNYATGGTTTGIGLGSASIALADFNGDGKLDIAVSNYASNTVSVFPNKGDGSFGSPVITSVNPSGALGLGAIVAGDFNEDGKMDLVVATIAGSQSDIVLLGNGDGTFRQGEAIANSFGFIQARAIDLNGDKHLDLVAAGNDYASIALGKSDGTFSPATDLPYVTITNPSPQPPPTLTVAPWNIDVGDVIGNGKADIVGVITYPSIAAGVAVYEGNGDGSFQIPTWQSTGSLIPYSVALADFNGDGKLDALLGFTYNAEVALGNGAGSFGLSSQTLVYSPTAGSQWVYVKAADLDQDGKPDALIVDDGAGVLTVVLNNGTGVLNGATHSYTIAPGICDIAAGDLNGDGMPDVVVINNLTNQISVFLSQSH